MQKFKTLYTFSFPKKVETSESETIINDSGETVTTSKKIFKDVEQEFCLQKPPRSLMDDADLFYNVTVSKGIQAGLMNAALLAKRLVNDGGVLSEQEKEEWGNMFVERIRKEEPLQKLAKKQGIRTDEEQLTYETLLKEVAILTRSMQEYEIRRQSLFDVTAEARARTRAIMWWLLFILHRKNPKGEWVPFFEGADLEEKQWAYDDLDDEDIYKTVEERNFNAVVVSHAIQAITLWYYGRVASQEEFKKAFEEEAKASSLFHSPPATEETAEIKTITEPTGVTES